jgi:hypothetical protein
MTIESNIFTRSGSRVTRDPLVVFLYILLRDHLPAGVIEGGKEN